ncbi:hypothetical protein [uncultured Jatrophihabitans sp.]|uniref:hypothetical protein n=1 Tax=uncultured Jatrophihabitans sp. TaxID=1610747 RepID=UPI0035C96621
MSGPPTPGQQALAEAARLEQARIYGATLPSARTHRPAREQVSLTALSQQLEQPARVPDVAWRATSITGDELARVRERAQQLIARGLTPDRIAHALDVDQAVIAAVRAEMDRAVA